MVSDDFVDDEAQELLGEIRVQIGPVCQIFEPRDLIRFAGRIGRGKVVFGFEFPHSLCVFEPLAQCVDEDRIQTVDAFAMTLEDLGGFGGRISQAPILSV